MHKRSWQHSNSACTLTKFVSASVPVWGLMVTLSACGEAGAPLDQNSEPPEGEIAEAQASLAVAPALKGKVKYHPGHYYQVPEGSDLSGNFSEIVANEMASTATLRGPQIRYSWRELEPTQNNYKFERIAEQLSQLQSKAKRLVILLQTKSFQPDDHAVPDYLTADVKYQGGEFAYGAWNAGDQFSRKGYNIALWNNNVRDRLIALIRALGNRFNGEFYFEGLGIAETALGTPTPGAQGLNQDKFFDNLLVVNNAMRTYFPNTVTFQFLNYPPNQVEDFITGGKGLHSFGGGLGGPDVWLEDKGVNGPGRVYSYYDKVRHELPLLPSIMPGNFNYKQHQKIGSPPSFGELYNFARNNLNANYLFWSRVSAVGDRGHYTDVLRFLKNVVPQTAAGGLDTYCPDKYLNCYTN